MMKIETCSSDDPVFVTRASEPQKLHLRIGDDKPGKSRIAIMTAVQARILAYTLLAEVERSR